MRLVIDIIAAILLLGGAVFCLSGAIGLLRFPDTLSRLQASAKAQSLGLVIILLGAALTVEGAYIGLLLLIAAFQLVTAPVTGQILGRIAYRTNEVDRTLLTIDELAERRGGLRPTVGGAERASRTDPEPPAHPGDPSDGTGP